jgi:predicted  nucleic acid-binding Zn-ribbon protein
MNMGVFEFVLGIVLIATIGSIIKARYGIRTDKDGNDIHMDSNAGTENARLRSEIGSLKERIQVLERVITDSESSSTRLDREIEQLRDKNHV